MEAERSARSSTNPVQRQKLIWHISLPDQAGAYATPVGLLVLLLVFDWRLGLLSLDPGSACIPDHGIHDR